MTTEDRKTQRPGSSQAGSQDSTVHASEDGEVRDRRGIDLRRGLGNAARRVGTWNSRAAASGEEVGRAVRDTLFRHERSGVLPPRSNLEFPGLLEAETLPGLVTPDPVLIPHTALATSRPTGGDEGRARRARDHPRDRPQKEAAEGETEAGKAEPKPSRDILPPPTSQPPPPARRVASGIVLVAIAIGIGLIVSISLVVAVAWGASTLIDYFRS